MMRLLNDIKLARELRDSKVTSRQKMHYYMFFMMAIAIFTSPVMYDIFPPNLTVFSLYSYFLYIGMVVVGTLHCYKTNAAGDDKDFMARMICLGVPISMHILLLSNIVGLIKGLILVALTAPKAGVSMEYSEAEFIAHTFMFVVGIIMTVYVFTRTNSDLEIASGLVKDES